MKEQNHLESEVVRAKRVKFIDGTFNVHDAKEVLIAVLQDKVNFHGNLLLSNLERFGVDASNSEQRIVELRAEMEKVRLMLEDAEKSGALIQIDSQIEIKVKQ